MTLKDYDQKMSKIRQEVSVPYEEYVKNFTDKQIDTRTVNLKDPMLKLGNRLKESFAKKQEDLAALNADIGERVRVGEEELMQLRNPGMSLAEVRKNLDLFPKQEEEKIGSIFSRI